MSSGLNVVKATGGLELERWKSRSQFSTRRSSTRKNFRSLSVTTVCPARFPAGWSAAQPLASRRRILQWLGLARIACIADCLRLALIDAQRGASGIVALKALVVSLVLRASRVLWVSHTTAASRRNLSQGHGAFSVVAAGRRAALIA